MRLNGQPSARRAETVEVIVLGEGSEILHQYLIRGGLWGGNSLGRHQVSAQDSSSRYCTVPCDVHDVRKCGEWTPEQKKNHRASRARSSLTESAGCPKTAASPKPGAHIGSMCAEAADIQICGCNFGGPDKFSNYMIPGQQSTPRGRKREVTDRSRRNPGSTNSTTQ